MRMPDPMRIAALAAGLYFVTVCMLILVAKALNGVIWS